MDALIRPEIGLMFWTILIFILLVVVLSKTTWRPLIKAVEDRERAIRHDRETAEQARNEAVKIKEELEARLKALKAEVEARLSDVRAEGNRERDLIIEDAKKSAELLLETAKRDLEAQKNALAKELKDTVAELSFMAAEKVLLKNIDQKANKELVAQFIKEMEHKDPRFKLGE